MTTANEIPLSPKAQSFQIELGGIDYQMRWRWCTPAACWVLDIADVNAVPIVCGLPVITGADILGQHKHLGIPGALIAQTDHNPDAVPTFTNLGVTGHVYFVA